MNKIKKISDNTLLLVNFLFSLFILMMIFALVSYAGLKTLDVFLDFSSLGSINILHEAAILIVLVKAYKVLLYYYKRHTVSIKYIMEISIIAPAIDIVFGIGDRPLWITVLFAIFSLGNLILYLYFYDKLSKIDESECRLESEIEKDNKDK